VELGQYAQAVEMSDKMVSIRPDLRSYARISYLRELHGEVKGAQEALQMAVDAGYPGYEQTAWCRVTLGNLYERYGDLDQAAMHYQIALDERPGFAFAIAGLASVEAKRGNDQKAIELLDQAAAIIPEVSFHVDKAAILADLGKTEEAHAMALEAADMMQEDTEKGHNMDLEYARLYLDLLDDAAKAKSYAEKEYRVRPSNVDVNKVLAACELQLGNLAMADKHIQSAMATKTQDPETQVLSGLIMVRLGDVANGKARIRAGFKADPYLSSALCQEALKQI
jgi:tetratricopeptide (TPR) repeat protein